MAKPPKHDAEFFPFYAKNGRTLKILQHRFKLTGIGFFTNLMRLLCTTPHHHLDLSEEVDRLVVYTDIGCEPEEAEAMIATMVMTGKLSRRLWEERRVLYSADLVESLWGLYEKRTTAPPTEADLEALYNVTASETPVTASETGESVTGTGVNVPVMPHRIEEDRIGKKSTPERAREVVDTFEPQKMNPVFTTYRDGMSKHLPSPAWPNKEKQFAALREMVKITEEIAPASAIPEPIDFAREILNAFERKKSNGDGEYWKGASWEPVTVLRRFGELVTELGQKHEKGQKQEAFNQAYRDFEQRKKERDA